MNCDTQNLMNKSACFRCIPRMFRREVMLYLWCRIAVKGLPKH